jgi:hypothetical protein
MIKEEKIKKLKKWQKTKKIMSIERDKIRENGD